MPRRAASSSSTPARRASSLARATSRASANAKPCRPSGRDAERRGLGQPEPEAPRRAPVNVPLGVEVQRPHTQPPLSH
eukprot:6471692-Lingulodinium_polyedra.AAC.1